MKQNPLSRPRFTAALPGLAALLLTCSLPNAQAQTTPPADSGMHNTDMSKSMSPRATDRAHRSEEKFLMKAHASGMREIQLSQLAASRATDPRVRSYAQMLVTEHQQMAEDLKPLLSSSGLDKSMLDSSMARDGTSATADSMRVGSADASTANRSSTSSTDANMKPGTYSTPGRPAASGTDTGMSSGDSSSTGKSSDTTRTGDMARADGNRAMASDRNEAAGASNEAMDSGNMDKSGKGVRDRWSRMLNERKQKKLMEKTGADFDKAYINLMVDEHESAVDLFQDGADESNQQVQMFAAKYLPKLRQHLEAAEQLDKNLK